MSHALKNISRFYNIIPRGIVHIGANSGQEVADYKESAIRPVVLVEPLEDPFSRLVAAVGGEKDFFPIQACLSNQSGREVEFHVASNGGQASSYYAPGSHLDIYPQVTFDKNIKLVTQTLDDLLNELSDKIDVSALDYISLDTQGAELDILQGASATLRHTKFVYCEVSYLGLYKEAPSLYDIIAFMRAQNFDICQLVMRNKGWGDALFAKKGTIGN